MVWSFLPNILSSSRLGLIPFFMVCCHRQWYLICLMMCLWALLSDYLDGVVARGLNASSSLGAVLDPAADKLFLVSALASLYLDCRLELFYVIVVLQRYIVQLLFFPIVRSYQISFDIKPSLLAKTANCFVYFIVLLELYLCLQETILQESFFFIVRQSLFILSGLCEIFFMIYYPYRFYLILNKKTRVF